MLRTEPIWNSILKSAIVSSLLILMIGCGRQAGQGNEEEEEAFITKLSLDGSTDDVLQADENEQNTVAAATVSGDYEVVGENLLLNGGFENHNLKPRAWKVFDKIDGWNTVSGAGVEVQNGIAGKAYEGNAKIELDSHGSSSNSAIVQEFKTSSKTKYRLSLAYSPRPKVGEGSNKVEVLWNNEVIATLAEDGKSLNNTKWTIHTFDLAGAEGRSALGFRATGKSNTYGGYIDAVSVYTLAQKVVVVDPTKVEAVVVDNSAATLSGEWEVSTEISGFNAENYVHNKNKDAVGKNATFNFNLLHNGYWRVYARWTQHSNRATNAVYKITHADGATEVAVNQREHGAEWNDIGAYKFDEGTRSSHVMLTAGEESDGFVIADAIKLVYLGTQVPSTALSSPIMLDNNSAGYVKAYGNWVNSNVVKQYEGIGYLHDNNEHEMDASNQPIYGMKRVVYTPDFAAAGKYRVLIRWTSHPNRATNALYVVGYKDGQDRFSVNQRLRGGEYHELGIYEFAAGRNVDNGSVIIQRPNDANGYVIADGVKFELVTE